MQKPVSSYFSDFIFYEKGHRYKNLAYPDLKFTSSTAIKTSFLDEFRDRYWIAWTVVKAKYTNRRCDFKGGVPRDHFKIAGNVVHYEKVWSTFPEECLVVEQDWEDKSTEGKARGSAVHDFLENLFLRKMYATPKKYGVSIRNAYEYWQQERANPDIIFRECEVIMGDVETQTCGMADRLDYPDIPWTVDLVDYKTDDGLDDSTVFSMMPAPFAHLSAIPINEYSIQVNIYADLIEMGTPYKVRDLKLVSVGEEKWQEFKLDRFNVINLYANK